MNTTDMNIAITLNRIYVPAAYTMLTSLLENNSIPCNIYVVYQDLQPEDLAILSCLSASYTVTFIHLPVTNISCPVTQLRFLLKHFLPKTLDRILYLDCDLIVTGALYDLYTTNFSGKKYACCQNHTPDKSFQSGVLLQNLSELRKSDDSDMISIENTIPLDFMKYNLQASYAFSQLHIRSQNLPAKTCIVHYSGDKPWHGDHIHNELEKIWWDYAEKNPFYPALLSQTMQEIIMGQNVPAYASGLKHENQQLTDIAAQYEILIHKLLPD